MLNLITRRPRRHRRELEPYRAKVSVADTNPALRIRDLLEDPHIRRALGLDEQPAVRTVRTVRTTRAVQSPRTVQTAA